MMNTDAIVEKWKSRASGSGQTWLDGINAVTISPGQSAVAKADKWRAKMMLDETFTKWKNRTGAVTLQAWQAICKNKGAGRYTSGITASVDKFRTAFTQVASHIQAGLDKIRSMPSTTLEDNIARSAAWIRHMASFQRTA